MSGAQSRTDWFRKWSQCFRGGHPLLHHTHRKGEVRPAVTCDSPAPDRLPARICPQSSGRPRRTTPHRFEFNSAHTVKLAEKMVRDFVCYLNDSLTQIQVVCQFFLRGSCKFGDQCRNEHPQNGDRRSAFGGQSSVALHCLGSSISL